MGLGRWINPGLNVCRMSLREEDQGAKRPVRRLQEKCSLEETWCSDPGQLAFRGKSGEGFGKSSEEEAGVHLDAGHEVGTKTTAAPFMAWMRLESGRGPVGGKDKGETRMCSI